MRNNQRRLGVSQTGGAPPAPSPAPGQANLAYVVPTEFVELPSRGLFYPEGHPLHKPVSYTHLTLPTTPYV